MIHDKVEVTEHVWYWFKGERYPTKKIKGDEDYNRAFKGCEETPKTVMMMEACFRIFICGSSISFQY